MRRLVVGLVMVAAVLLAGVRRADADDAMWQTFRGRVMFSDVALAPADNFASSATMMAALRRLERTSSDQTAGFWRLHMIAFLDHPAATDALVLRAIDMRSPRERREVRVVEPRQVRVFEVPVERGTREVRLDDFVVTEGMGFERGVSYELRLEAPTEEGGVGAMSGETKKAGKADVYAKGVITLR
jgi:hypothetical protein